MAYLAFNNYQLLKLDSDSLLFIHMCVFSIEFKIKKVLRLNVETQQIEKLTIVGVYQSWR